jgi:hypothetical protein
MSTGVTAPEVKKFYKNDLKHNRKRFIVIESGSVRTAVSNASKSG